MAATEGGVSLDVIPDTRDFWPEFKRQIAPGAKSAGNIITKALAKAVKDGAAQGARDFARDLKTKVAAAAKSIPAVKIPVTAETREVEARLAALEAEVRKLNGTEVKLKVDKKSGDFLGGIAKDASLARIALVGLGPAAIPVLGAVTAAAIPLGAALGAAGVATGAFGLVAKQVFGDITDAQKKLKTAQDAYNNATTKAGKAEALKQQKAVLDGLSTSQRKLLVATTQTQSAWERTKKSLAAPVANGLVPWMSASRKAMALLKPLITPVSLAIHDLGVSVDRYLANRKNVTGLQSFAENVGHLGAVTLRRGITVTSNVLQGVFKLVKDFAPAGNGMGSTVERLAKRFNAWAGSVDTKSGIQRFLADARTNLPTIAHALKNVGEAAANVTKVLSAFGPSSLVGVSLLASLVSKMPPSVLKAIAIGWVGIAVAQKGILAAEKLQLIASGIKAMATSTVVASAATKAWAAVQWVLDAALDANPIGLVVIAIAALVAAIVLAWKNSKTFRTIVTGAFQAVSKAVTTAVSWIVSFVKAHWKLLLAIIGGPLVAIVLLVTSNWSKIKGAFRAGTSWVTNRWHDFWSGASSTARRIGGSIVGAVTSFLGKVKSAFRAGVQDVKSIWSGLKKVAQDPIRFVIDKVINHGILWAWDTVAKMLHLPTKLQIPYLTLPFANGGIAKYFANGGVENHTAQIAPAGAMRVWAEPETGGEAYIPMSPNKRERSTAILGQVADSFGYRLEPFANGGFWGNIGKVASNIVGKGIDFAKSTIQAITDPGRWISAHLTKPVKGLLGKVGDSSFAKAGVAIGEKSLDAMTDAVKKLLGMFSGGGGSSAMVALAKTQLGYREGAGNSNKYSHELGRPSEEWCADFVDWLALKTGNRSAVPWTASAPGMARAFGSKYHSGTSGAVPGDIVFFGPSKAGIYHVGLAAGAGGSGSIPTIAGNSSNMVRAYTGTGIAGYAHPNYPNPGTVGSPGSLVHASPSAAKDWARQSLKTQGWGLGQFDPLERLWTRESGWRWNALNRSSGAYGIPQSLPASKMKSAGSDWHDNAGTQINWGLGYIKGRYGSPAGAWAHSQRTGWYDSGGYLPPGLSLSYNGTGGPERLYTAHQVQGMGLRGGDGASLIGELNVTVPQGSSARELVDEVDHRVKVIHHSGRYGRG